MAGWRGRRSRTMLAITLTVAVLAVALWHLDIDGLLQAARQLPAGSIAACIALIVVVHLAIATRWAIIAAPQGAGFSRDQLLVCLHASLFNLITPGALGADIYRVVRGGENNAFHRTGLVLAERFWGLGALAVLYTSSNMLTRLSGPGLGTAFSGRPGAMLMDVVGLIAAVGALAAAGIAFGGAAWLDRRFHRAQGRSAEVLRAMMTAIAARSRRQRALLALLSLISVSIWAGAAAVLARSGGPFLALPQIAMITVLTEFSRLLPLSIQGIGVREATFAWLSADAGGSPEAGFVVCAVLYGLNYMVVGVLAFCAGACLGAASEPTGGKGQQ